MRRCAIIHWPDTAVSRSKKCGKKAEDFLRSMCYTGKNEIATRALGLVPGLFFCGAVGNEKVMVFSDCHRSSFGRLFESASHLERSVAERGGYGWH